MNAMNRNDQEFEVQKIRTQYMEKGHTGLDALKELDAEVKRPAIVASCVLGSIGAIVMGSGMSLTMTDIGTTLGMENGMIPGIVIGVIGMAMMIAAYPLHQALLSSRRRKYADEILRLSDQIMGEK